VTRETQPNELETYKNALVKNEVNRMYANVAILTILYTGRNCNSNMGFSFAFDIKRVWPLMRDNDRGGNLSSLVGNVSIRVIVGS
jgi:hypothetical protein